MLKQSVLTLALLGLVGCAGVRVPADRLERSEASIRGAEELGAANVPAARLHLQMAKDQTEAARVANSDERATGLLARAESDAELSLGLAREAAVHRDATQAAEDLRALHTRDAP